MSIVLSFFGNSGGVVTTVQVTSGLTFTFIFQILFTSFVRSWYLSVFFRSFSTTYESNGTAKSIIRHCFLALSIAIWSERLASITLSV